MTDPVSDFLTRLRNGAAAQHHDVAIPYSKLKTELARILSEQGYIEGYDVLPAAPGTPGGELRVTLKYTNERAPVITGLQRISRPGGGSSSRSACRERASSTTRANTSISAISRSRGITH